MSHRALIRFGLSVVLTLLVAACGNGRAPSFLQNNKASTVKNASSTADIAEVYIVPNKDSRLDGIGYLVMTANGSHARSILGDFTQLDLRPALGGGFTATGFSQSADGALFRIDAGQQKPRVRIEVPAGQLPVLGDDGQHYFYQVGATVHEVDHDGHLKKTIPLKIHKAPKNGFRVDGKPTKIVVTDGPGTVAAYLTASDGSVFAVINTWTSVELTNLASGQARDINTYNTVLDATIDSNGQMLIAAWNRSSSDSTLHVVWIDPSDLSIKGDADTGFKPAATNTVGCRLLATSNHGVFVFVASNDAGITHDVLWAADSSSKTVRPGAQLPNDIGISAAVDPADTIYFFNGPAKNVVSSWSPTTGAFTADSPQLDGPSGSYVTGLAF